MKLHLLHVVTFLSVALVASRAAVSPDGYWKSVLPNTPMPKAVTDLLPNGVGKEGVNVHAGKNGKRVYVGVPLPVGDLSIFYRKWLATEDQLKNSRNVAIFFLEKDMHQGMSMNFHFTKPSTPASFLPRQEADSIPFSSSKLSQVYDHFSVKSGSFEAKIIKQTISECEEPSMKGEEKYCTTSLESMVDFSTSKLGKKVQALSTEVDKETDQLQKYTIVGVRKYASDKAVVCHRQNYAYAVFYCHKFSATKSYMVSLVGADGSRAKAVATCHEDTASWNPKHLAFQVLKVKPGTVPVCHFLPQDHIVWVPY